jgi:hypothetical protein
MRARAIAAGIAACIGFLTVAVPVRAGGGGNVMPPTAQPHGFSLTGIARLVAPFTASGNNPAFFPETPFQILFVDPATSHFEITDIDHDGLPELTGVGTNRFVVPTGTMFYVPIINADDTPPDGPFFPTTQTSRAGVIDYFFGQSQLGAEGMTIIVDGQATEIGPPYLSDLLSFPSGLPSGATRYLTLGVFLTPLTPGTHTVTIRGKYAGDALPNRDGLDSFGEDITYTVDVVPGGKE